MYRGVPIETDRGSEPMLQDHFPGLRYRDVPGLCKVASKAEIEAQGWSLNPGRYVGVKETLNVEEADFQDRLEALHEELEQLNAEAHTLEDRINENINQLLGV
jgi:type I restriction enzyme M protein